MKKILFALCAIFVAGAGFSQTRKLNLEFLNNELDKKENVYVPTGKEPNVVVQEEHSGVLRFCKYSSDGKYIVSVADEIKVWEADSGLLIRTINLATQTGYSFSTMDISADGKYILFARDTTKKAKFDVAIYSLETGDCVFSKFVNSQDINLFFSPDSKYFIIEYLNDEGKIHVYNFNNKKEAFVLREKKYINWKTKEISFSEDSRYMCAVGAIKGADYQNVVWDLQTKRVISSFPVKNIYKSLISMDGTKIYTILTTGVLIVYDIYGKQLLKFDTGVSYAKGIKESADGKNLIISNGLGKTNGCFVFDAKNGKKIHTITDKGVACVAVSKVRNEYAIIQDKNRLDIYNSETMDFIKAIPETDENSFGYIPNIVLDGHAFVKGNSLFVNYGLTISDIPNYCSYSRFSTNRAFFLYSNSDYIGYYENFDFHKESSFKLTTETGVIKNLYACQNDNIIVYTESDRDEKNTKYCVYDINAQKVIFSCMPSDYNVDNYYLSLSPNGTFLIFNTTGYGEYYKKYEKVIVDTRTGKYATSPSDPNFSPDDKYCNIYNNSFDTLYDSENWNALSKSKHEDNFIDFSVAFLHNKNQYARLVKSDDSLHANINIYNLNGSVQKRIKTDLPPTLSSVEIKYISKDDKYIYIKRGSTLKTYSLESGNLLTTTIIKNDMEWLTYTPEGYFTGSEKGINKFIHLVDGMQVFELGQLYDTLYRPDIVADKIAGKKVPSVASQILKTGNAPKVTFIKKYGKSEAREVEVEFSVVNSGGGIGYVYLTQNGKVIYMSEERQKADKNLLVKCGATLFPGENIFEAYATNSAGKIESRHAQTKISWQGKTEKPNLYVLAMGVNDYSDKKIQSLAYSVSDAKAISEVFSSNPSALYDTVSVLTLLDSDVNKTKINAAFDTLAEKIRPDDVFILHIAGHGTNVDGEYYFLPSDTAIKKFEKTAISKYILAQNLSKLQAQKSIILLDTCNSGAFLENDIAHRTALERLANKSHETIITASASDQFANEGYESHGFFTYVVLEAMKGEAAFGDDFVTVNELIRFVSSEVPNLAKKMNAGSQTPWSSPVTEDFNIVSTTSSDKTQSFVLEVDGKF